MAKLNINDFELGDKVVHASSSSTIMIVTEIDTDRSQITCRWVNLNKETQSDKFIPQELIKYESLSRGIYNGPNNRDKHHY
jgi:hypothetical protein